MRGGGPTPFVMTTDVCIIVISGNRFAFAEVKGEVHNVYLYTEYTTNQVKGP